MLRFEVATAGGADFGNHLVVYRQIRQLLSGNRWQGSDDLMIDNTISTGLVNANWSAQLSINRCRGEMSTGGNVCCGHLGQDGHIFSHLLTISQRLSLINNRPGAASVKLRPALLET